MQTTTLTQNQLQIIYNFRDNEIKSYQSSKDLLFMMVDYFKDNKGINKSTIKSNLTKVLKTQLPNNNMVTRAKKLMAVADNYEKFNLNEDLINKSHIYNIETMVNVLDYISSNEDKCVIGFKEALDSINNINSDVHQLKVTELNNQIATVLKDIKVANKIIESEKGIIEFNYTNVFNTLKDNLDKLSDEDKNRLIELLAQ